MTSVDDVTGHIDNTAPVLDGSLGNARAVSTEAEQVAAGLIATKDETEKLAEAFANLGATGKAALATQAAGQAEELTTSAHTAKTNIDSTVDHLAKLKDDLQQLRTQVETLRGLLHATTGSAPGTTTEPVAPRPAGTWVPTPGGTRHFGHPFNQDYEEWVRTSTGGPATGSEYLVEHNGKKAHFDATTTETRDGQPTEVLIDAKGRYAQLVDKKTGDFHGFFRGRPGQGVDGMLEDARRQVDVADGRPVEWWCAEETAADAFDQEFDEDHRLSGRIEAVHKPMPGSLTLGCNRELETVHRVKTGGFELGGRGRTVASVLERDHRTGRRPAQPTAGMAQ